MNPTPINPTRINGEPGSDDLTDHMAEDLHWAVTLVEDWLLHASPETLDELADFAYGPARHRHDHHLRWIIDLLGEAAARLRPAPPAAREPTTTAARGPGR